VPLYTDALVLIAGPGHRLAAPGSGRRVRLADLAGEVLVLFGRSSSSLELTTATFRQAGVLPTSVLELDNLEAAKKMVERGLGVSLVPVSTVTAELAAGTLAQIELVDAAPVPREIVAVRRRDAGPPSGAAGLFLELLTAPPPG
jgi:DNA-binding transcriptional LysR family regulator